MIEIMVERWSGRDGGEEFRWSLWQNGRRLTMGGPHPTAEASEAEARAACAKLQLEPGRVTRL
jgi:hypothetical protein